MKLAETYIYRNVFLLFSYFKKTNLTLSLIHAQSFFSAKSFSGIFLIHFYPQSENASQLKLPKNLWSQNWFQNNKCWVISFPNITHKTGTFEYALNVCKQSLFSRIAFNNDKETNIEIVVNILYFKDHFLKALQDWFVHLHFPSSVVYLNIKKL